MVAEAYAQAGSDAVIKESIDRMIAEMNGQAFSQRLDQLQALMEARDLVGASLALKACRKQVKLVDYGPRATRSSEDLRKNLLLCRENFKALRVSWRVKSAACLSASKLKQL